MLVAPALVLASCLFSLAAARTQTSPASAVASPDGVIVPFSTLPACASKCGHLFDAQGACSPPVTDAPSQSCFCSNSLLTSIAQGTAGVQAACGATSCQDTASLQAIQNWYLRYCNKGTPTTATTAPGSSATGSSSTAPTTNNQKPANKTWIQSHYGWVIFVIVVALAIIGGWVTASYFRRRYLRKKEKEIEMRPPVSLGPHQMQAMTGGFNPSEVALGSGAGRVSSPLGPETQEVGSGAVGNRESRGWLRKERR